MSRFTKLFLVVAATLFVAFIIWRGGKNSLQEYQSEQFLMDTVVSIKVYGRDSETMKKAVNSAFNEMRRIAALTNWFPEEGSSECNESDICRINHNAGKSAVTIKPETFEILKLSQHYYRASRGAFDILIAPLIDLYGFGGKSPHLPEAEEIKELLAARKENALILNEADRSAFIEKKGKIDLGAVVKGYATERAANILKSFGIEKSIIDAGGNIKVIGNNVSNRAWKIGVKDPRSSDKVAAVLHLTDESAVTSGDYYRYFEENGVRYHHILDPHTGYPPRHTISATVVAKDATVADILSTVSFILKPDEAIKFVQTIPDVDLFLITSDRKIMHTPGLSKKIEITKDSGYKYDQG